MEACQTNPAWWLKVIQQLDQYAGIPHRSRRKRPNIFKLFLAPRFSSLIVAQELAPRDLLELDGPKGCFWGPVVCGDELSFTAKTGTKTLGAIGAFRAKAHAVAIMF